MSYNYYLKNRQNEEFKKEEMNYVFCMFVSKELELWVIDYLMIKRVWFKFGII